MKIFAIMNFAQFKQSLFYKDNARFPSILLKANLILANYLYKARESLPAMRNLT